ncbi:MAG: hypothetical protein JW737_04880 [Acidobacteria bacterium]|nr:hypothetical protein [Acidobacteriota bacterium]
MAAKSIATRGVGVFIILFALYFIINGFTLDSEGKGILGESILTMLGVDEDFATDKFGNIGAGIAALLVGGGMSSKRNVLRSLMRRSLEDIEDEGED